MLLFSCSIAGATDYYLDAEDGNDSNTGTTPDQAWSTLAKASGESYGPGDKILLQRGDSFTGKLLLNGVSGSAGNPILVASFGEGNKPFIDAAGYLAGVEIRNSRYVEVNDLEITANGGLTVDGSARERYGVLVRANNGGVVSHVTVRNMTIHDIYPEFDSEHEGKNPTTYLGTGVRLWGIAETTSSHFLVENCDIQRVGYKMVEMRRVSYVEILNNYGEKIGGPALQPSRVDDLLVRGNTINGSGDYSDPRMHGRGSGIWPWGSNRVLIEKNRFMHARGRGDSCGAHIDFNCTDVVVQYNLSYDNEGGFVEILGNNYNCAYRYNISINDGARIAGVNGANANGRTLWTSGFVGQNGTPVGPFNSYIYNNTIYVKEDQHAVISLQNTTEGLLIANNIFVITGPVVNQTSASWSQEDLDRVVWQNNLYQKAGILPESLPFTDTAPLVGDPGFANEGGFEPEDYEAFFFENVKDRGIVVEAIPGDATGLRIGTEVTNDLFGLQVTEDFFGNPIEGLPDLGAIETADVRPALPDKASFEELPTVLEPGQVSMTGMRTFEPVEYYFAELSGNSGGNDSGWQIERYFEDQDLLPNTTYRYQVSIRDGMLQSLVDSVEIEVTTPVLNPFEDILLLEEDFNGADFRGNLVGPFPANAWHLDNSTPWQRDNSGTSVAIESSGAASPFRLGWGFDEVEIRYYVVQPIGTGQGYRFYGAWRIKSLLPNSLGFIAGIGEYDRETGSLVKRIKEQVFGELINPQVDQTGTFEIEVSPAELVAAGVNPSNYIGVFFHHDDNGVLFQEASDSNDARNDVYLVDNLVFAQVAPDRDMDGDGMGDSFEDEHGLRSNDPDDAEEDLDRDGLPNIVEYLFGSNPAVASTKFLPPVASVSGTTLVSIPGEEVREGRMYILEFSHDLATTDMWRAIDSFSPSSNEVGTGFMFEYSGSGANGFFRVRIEWAR